jgi:TPR repeat protein
MYKGGLGTEKDEERAEHWLRPAADRGEDLPTLHLGRLYHNQGRFKEMVEYYERSAGRGYAPAICRLGVCHIFGFGVEMDKARGMELLADAARRGNVKARAVYGVQLIRGVKWTAPRE